MSAELRASGSVSSMFVPTNDAGVRQREFEAWLIRALEALPASRIAAELEIVLTSRGRIVGLILTDGILKSMRAEGVSVIVRAYGDELRVKHEVGE